MNAETFCEEFATFADAPDGIEKLREMILQLAVQGKLVPQDSTEEASSKSLARNDERRQATADGDHRADAELQPLLSAEDCWEIPESWSWRALADLVLFVDYRGKTPAKLESGIRLLTAKNVRKRRVNLSPAEFLSESEYKSWMTRGFPKTGDVLFTTEAPMGNAAVVELDERFALAQRVICFQTYGAVDPHFLVIQILSNGFQSILDKNGTGVTAKGIKASKLKQLPIAVPPLAEQRRIVAKVDQLLGLCDELGARQAARREARSALVAATLDRLVSPTTPAEFPTHAGRLRNHFDQLFDTPTSIPQLRQSILQLAVQGKLVAQDPADEPATELISQICTERSRLAKSGKRVPRLPAVEERQLPQGWAPVRLGAFVELISGQHLLPVEYNESRQGHPYLTGPADFGDRFPVATRWTQADRALAYRDDILITVKGAGIGKTNIVATETAFISRQLMAVRPILVDRDFVHLVLRSGYDYFQRLGVGIAIPGIGRDDILHFEAALPPLAEQKRIVAKVTELLSLCEALEAKLAQAESTSTNLLAAAVHHLLNGHPTSA